MLLVTTEQLADKLGVEPDTIHKWRQRYADDFPVSKFRGVHDLHAVEAWAAKRGLPKKAQ